MKWPHTLTIRVSDETWAGLLSMAAHQEREVSDVVRRILADRAKQDLIKSETGKD